MSGAVGLLPARGRPLRCMLTAAVGRPSTLREHRQVAPTNFVVAGDPLDPSPLCGQRRDQEVLARYIGALGGTLELIADFGDEQLEVA